MGRQSLKKALVEVVQRRYLWRVGRCGVQCALTEFGDSARWISH